MTPLRPKGFGGQAEGRKPPFARRASEGRQKTEVRKQRTENRKTNIEPEKTNIER
jgi:hypothetical protein